MAVASVGAVGTEPMQAAMVYSPVRPVTAVQPRQQSEAIDAQPARSAAQEGVMTLINGLNDSLTTGAIPKEPGKGGRVDLYA